jgi:hypothetical protein
MDPMMISLTVPVTNANGRSTGFGERPKVMNSIGDVARRCKQFAARRTARPRRILDAIPTD